MFSLFLKTFEISQVHPNVKCEKLNPQKFSKDKNFSSVGRLLHQKTVPNIDFEYQVLNLKQSVKVFICYLWWLMKLQTPGVCPIPLLTVLLLQQDQYGGLDSRSWTIMIYHEIPHDVFHYFNITSYKCDVSNCYLPCCVRVRGQSSQWPLRPFQKLQLYGFCT